ANEEWAAVGRAGPTAAIVLLTLDGAAGAGDRTARLGREDGRPHRFDALAGLGGRRVEDERHLQRQVALVDFIRAVLALRLDLHEARLARRRLHANRGESVRVAERILVRPRRSRAVHLPAD